MDAWGAHPSVLHAVLHEVLEFLDGAAAADGVQDAVEEVVEDIDDLLQQALARRQLAGVEEADHRQLEA